MRRNPRDQKRMTLLNNLRKGAPMKNYTLSRDAM